MTIDFLIAGEFPGDGKPKAVVFPDPALIKLKLASGMTAPHRIKDLADVLELIRAAQLPADLATDLDPSVRQKYVELWQAAQAPERD